LGETRKLNRSFIALLQNDNKNMNIIVTGSLAFDQIMLYPGAIVDHIMPDKHHVLSTSFIVDHLEKNKGGVAGNICYNLGLLDKNPVCLASMGKDGVDYRSFLQKNNVNTDFIKIIDDDYTASFVVITDKKDCQISGFYEGAMKKDKDLSIKETLKKLQASPEETFLVIAPTHQSAMVSNISEAKSLNLRYLFSPSQQINYLNRKDLVEGIMGAEVLIGNDYEIAQLQEKSGMNANDILDNVRVVVTTFGEKGSLINQKGKQDIAIGVAKPKKIKDPTGVGDAYIAGFLSGYIKQKSLAECGQLAATTAAYALEEYGTTNHTFSLNIFNNRLKENFS
jgi:adenosine kinase